MLGLCQLLELIQRKPLTSKVILDYSHREKEKFPLACQLFDFTTRTLKVLRQGKLNT
jgi:hypothetical protein